MSYCLDTSAFIDAWERYYPPDVFPSVWTAMDSLMTQRTIVAPTDVFLEMKKKSDGVMTWAKQHKSLFVDLDTPIQQSLRAIMAQFPKLVDPRRGRSGADPVVIAVARVRRMVVVTGEKASGKAQLPKIPDACAHFGVRCCNVLEMFRELKMSF